MRITFCMVIALGACSIANAQTIDPAARDWYIEQKRIHKMGRIAVAEKDRQALYVLQRLNYDHGQKWSSLKPTVKDAVYSRCENFQLAVFSMIRAADGTDVIRADRASDDCWDAIAGR